MNTRLTVLTIVALALPLGLLGPSGALAQARNQANSPPAAGSGRQVISDKLERIRLDRVSYDRLPLGEVVLNLRDEIKKRDPEKKGINFMINPNQPAVPLAPDGRPLPAPSDEPVDISTIAVKIHPPL